MDKISVVLCTYNGEKHIQDQLNSIINQTTKPDEIIISDDISKDKTIEVAKNILKESNINYQINVNETNLGVTHNFQKAIDSSSGDIIFLSDQDDIWVEDKIKLIKEAFDNNPNCIMVFTDAELVDEKRNKLGVKLWETLGFTKEMLEEKNLLDILLNRCIVTGATMAFRRELFTNISNESFPKLWIHDGWLAINSPLLGQVVCIDLPLIEYRQHDNNVIGASKATLYKRIINYVNNIKKLEEVRIIRYERYKAFYEFNENRLSSQVKKEVQDCIEFWGEMRKLKEVPLNKGLKIIFNQYSSGNYKNFYTGIIGAIRDVTYMFYKRRAA